MTSCNTPYTLQQLAIAVQATLYGDATCTIHAAASLANAKAGEITFIENPHYLDILKKTHASAVVLTRELQHYCPQNALVVTKPRLAFSTILSLLHPPTKHIPGIHPSAAVGLHTRIHPSAVIGPHVVLGTAVEIGPDVVIHAGCYIGNHVVIGAGSHLYPRVTLYDGVQIGEDAILHSGAVIGSDGFGFEPNLTGEWVKIPQIGSVIIGNAVEIGANTTIDRGALDNTIIGDGVKLDNQVMVGHNVQIGDHTIIAGCTGIAGSTKIGKHCIIGGACTINGHITLGDRVVLTGAAMVTGSLLEPGVYSSGTGVLPQKKWQKCAVRFRQLDTMYERLRRIEHEAENTE